MKRRTKSAAAHEAGHALAAVLLGFRVEEVCLDETDALDFGHCIAYLSGSSFDAGIYYAAGAAGDALNNSADWGAQDDRNEVLKMGFTKRDWLNFEALAKGLLSRNRAAWEALTLALWDHDLDGEEVEEICLGVGT